MKMKDYAMRLNCLRKLTSVALISIALSLISGCQNGGDLMGALSGGSKKYELAYLKQNLIPGKTTKAQVMALFGAPHEEELQATNGRNDSNWTYDKREEGVDKYVQLAHKYVSTETSLKMYSASAQVNRVDDAVSDVNSVVGTKRAASKVTGSELIIYFKDDVIDYYRLF
ncbi:hypothetical protein ACMSIO_21560 [Pseudomonas benzopyrenica]|uniref:hypothetical protein n=1 Tax=Pseudomonas benzopyrenica TaxID=2993566 RepID=UPI0039C1338A